MNEAPIEVKLQEKDNKNEELQPPQPRPELKVKVGEKSLEKKESKDIIRNPVDPEFENINKENQIEKIGEGLYQ